MSDVVQLQGVCTACDSSSDGSLSVTIVPRGRDILDRGLFVDALMQSKTVTILCEKPQRGVWIKFSVDGTTPVGTLGLPKDHLNVPDGYVWCQEATLE